MKRWLPFRTPSRLSVLGLLCWYRFFLALYPSSYRSRFADEMYTVFAEAMDDARQESWWAVMLLCWREARDLPHALYREHRQRVQAWLTWQLREDAINVSDIPGVVPVGQGSLPHILYVITGRNPWLRRIFDIALALTGFIIAFPLLFILPLLIKLDSSGPIFYRQRRVGKGGQPYIMYKFRSMSVSQSSGLLHVTRVGRWVRRWHWDEIPQIFNVLRGDMSVFGPRPPLSN